MGNESIKIIVGADLSRATSQLNNFSATVAKTGTETAKAFDVASSSATKLPAAITPAISAIKNLSTAALPIPAAFDEVAASAKAFFEIDAAIERASKEAKEFKTELSNLGTGRAPLTSILQLQASVAKLKADLATGFKPAFSGIPAAVNPATDALKKISPSSNSAALALTNVGRVAQDLPFGFIGIQNNLNPLLESFQRLKAETGSSGAALKALGSSLIGAGGIGLALSVVSSAILIFQNGIGGFNRKSKEAKEAADDLAKSIRSISSIEGEAVAGVQGQIAQVQSLAEAVSDSNRPYEQRKRALEELKEINKAYFNDLKIEDAATGKLTATVKSYTEALINNAIQKQFVEEIATLAKKVAESDDVIKKSRDALTRAQEEVSKKQIAAVRASAAADGSYVDKKIALLEAQDAEKKATEALAQANDKSTQLLEQQLVVRDNLNKAVAEGLKFKDLDGGKTNKEIDLLKQRISVLKELQSLTGLTGEQKVELAQLEIQLASRDAVKLGFSQSELQQQIEGILESAFPVKTFSFELEAQPDLKLLPAKIGNSIDVTKALKLDKIPLDFADPIIERMKAIGEKMKELKLGEQAKATAEAVANVLTPAFDGLFNAILNGQNAFEAVGDALKRLISDMIKAIVRAAALAAVFSLIFPAGKGGLNFLGAFKKFLGGGFKDGGVASGPQSGYLALLHGTELIVPMNKIAQINNAGIQGTAINSAIILQPSVAIQGQALRILLNRVDATNGRLF